MDFVFYFSAIESLVIAITFHLVGEREWLDNIRRERARCVAKGLIPCQ